MNPESRERLIMANAELRWCRNCGGMWPLTPEYGARMAQLGEWEHYPDYCVDCATSHALGKQWRG